MRFIKEKIAVGLENLKSLSHTRVCSLDFEYVKCGYKQNNKLPGNDAKWQKYDKNTPFYKGGEHYWFRFSIEPQKAEQGKSLIFSLKTGREDLWDLKNPQGTLFLNGEVVQGLDTNHTWTRIEFEKKYDVYIYFYTGTDDGYFDVLPELYLRDTAVYDLYYDISVPYETMLLQDENSYEYMLIRDTLDKALMYTDFRYPYSADFYNGIKNASDYMKSEFYEGACGKSLSSVSLLGHTHIDVAYLWTIQQTREKTERSFATVLKLMEEYPEYVFFSSQPLLYQFIKDQNPELYERIKQRISEGRWEADGGMWVEADCNITSGESLVRQILYGKKFFRDAFGVDSKILWLPDVFGYSGALPQIMKKSGIDKFFGTKTGWNETNRMPHDIFMWKGIDGTEIFTCFSDFYFNVLNAETVHRMSNLCKDKSLSDTSILTVGFSDGGGGTTSEMIEIHRRLKYGLPGMPRTEFNTAIEFFNQLEKDFKRNTEQLKFIPKWEGEIYLELHRGTYTSMAKNKLNNRKCELLYQKAETLSVTDMILNGGEYDKETIYKNMISILVNQFHDILPGSSIKEVYDTTDTEYEHIIADGMKILEEKMSSIISNICTDGGIFVYNSSPFKVSDYIRMDDKLYFAKNIPPHGYKVINAEETESDVVVCEKRIENSLICVEFDDAYNIISLFDKETNREVIQAGQIANRLEIYEDYPKQYDAWEISDYYKQKKWYCDDVTKLEMLCDGFKIVRKYCSSEIVQKIILKPYSKRIDFVTDIDWHEDHVLLKAVFPVDIHSTSAVYDIQFGNIERPTHRNTSWDEAKFEVYGQKWMDISEDGYGVSILNDCKYGFSAEENIISVSLLKAATYPNIEADRGHHSFTYSIYPHKDDFKRGGTVREAYLLNMPLELKKIAASDGELNGEFCLVSSNCENVVTETIKKAENDNSVIIRMYECFNRKSLVTLTLGFDFKEAYICNLLEEEQEKLSIDGNCVTFSIKNYEIVTLKLR